MVAEKVIAGHLGTVTEIVNALLKRPGVFLRPGVQVVYHPAQQCMVMVCVVAKEDGRWDEDEEPAA